MVTLKAGAASAEAKEYNFSSIDRAEYNSLNQYLNSKKIHIRNVEEVRCTMRRYRPYPTSYPTVGSDDDADPAAGRGSRGGGRERGGGRRL